MSNYLTIDGLESMTEQQNFGLSAKHIMTTQQKSVSDNGLCVYSGIGCAASVFIKPEFREEADSTGSGSWNALTGYGVAPLHNLNLICLLQNAHDDAPSGERFIPGWNSNMRDIADTYNLDVSKLEIL